MTRTASRRIALVMIARDAERSIARALDSAAPYVDEMVVLDTGSVDDTVEIARAHGARVGHFDWVDDFSAARNGALDLAGADWHLVLDSDEWIMSGGESLARLRDERRRYVGVMRREEFESFDDLELRYAGEVMRLLPGDVRYEFRVHEQPVHDLPAWRPPIVLGHDGYESTELSGKEGRNLRLLRLEVAQRPEHPYLSFKLAQELAKRGGFAEAEPLFAVAHRGGAPRAPWRHALVLGYLRCLADLGDLDGTLTFADSELGAWSHSPDFFFVLGNALLDLALAHPEQAGALLPMIEDAYLRCLEIGDRPELENSVIGHGSFLAAKNLYAYYESLGRGEQAAGAADLERELRRTATIRRSSGTVVTG